METLVNQATAITVTPRKSSYTDNIANQCIHALEAF